MGFLMTEVYIYTILYLIVTLEWLCIYKTNANVKSTDVNVVKTVNNNPPQLFQYMEAVQLICTDDMLQIVTLSNVYITNNNMTGLLLIGCRVDFIYIYLVSYLITDHLAMVVVYMLMIMLYCLLQFLSTSLITLLHNMVVPFILLQI